MTPLRWWKWVKRVVLLLLSVVVLLFAVTAVRVWYVARQDDHPRSDVIIVLGAAQLNGKPTNIFAARLDHAAQLYRLHVAPRIITVGGNLPGDRTTEGAAGARYLADHKVPSTALVPVGEGSDTYTSLQAAASVMRQHRWRSAVVVTDPWHSLRSRTMARDLGIEAETSPVTTGPVVRDRSTELRYIWRETLAYLYYEILGGHRKGPRAA
ncbi:MAG: YdcF family protein [Frankiaceae bacterium]